MKEKRGRDSQKVWKSKRRRKIAMLTLDGVITSVLRSEIGSKILRRRYWKFVPPSYHSATYLATEPGESVLRALCRQVSWDNPCFKAFFSFWT